MIIWLVVSNMALMFHNSYMGCHPKPIDELHHFSRWLLHQPVNVSVRVKCGASVNSCLSWSADGWWQSEDSQKLQPAAWNLCQKQSRTLLKCVAGDQKTYFKIFQAEYLPPQSDHFQIGRAFIYLAWSLILKDSSVKLDTMLCMVSPDQLFFSQIFHAWKLNGYKIVTNIPWRIHGAGIYANIKGVYGWDPCYHI